MGRERRPLLLAAFNDHTRVIESLLTKAGEAHTLVQRPQRGRTRLKRTDTLTTVNLVYLNSKQP
jgi:hypothetical protein